MINKTHCSACRRFLAVILGLVLLLSALTVAYAQDTRAISLRDLVLAAKALKDPRAITAEQLAKIDTNGNGRVELTDLVTLAKQLFSSSDNNTSNEWKTVLKNKVNELDKNASAPGYMAYKLIDINQDGIPELCDVGPLAQPGMQLYGIRTYNFDGGTDDLQAGMGIPCFDGKNLLYTYSEIRDNQTHIFWRIEDGEFVEAARGEKPYSGTPTWNGEPCTAEELDAHVQAMGDPDTLVFPFPYGESDSEDWLRSAQVVAAIDAY